MLLKLYCILFNNNFSFSSTGKLSVDRSTVSSIFRCRRNSHLPATVSVWKTAVKVGLYKKDGYRQRNVRQFLLSA